jgi:uncharacterized lipoprotein YmbA
MTLLCRLAKPRLVVMGSALLLVLGLAGCGTPLPPPQLYQLRAAPPVAVAPPAAAAPGAGPADSRTSPTLQLLLPVSLPELLERDAIVVPQGQAGVQALAGHRWAEPLRDAVPRLLRQDLAALLGNGKVWVAPLPAGLVVQRLLRVEVLALQADSTRGSVQLQARWTLSDPMGRAPVQTRLEHLAAPVQGSDIDALVVAHRLVLWRLAERLAQAAASQP